MRALAHHALQLAAGQDIELLVGAAKLYVRVDGDRVICLQQGIHELHQAQRLTSLPAQAKGLVSHDVGQGEA